MSNQAINDENIIIHKNAIETAIYDACVEMEIDDLKKEGQRPWKSLLMLVGKRVFPDTSVLKDKNIYNNNSCMESNCNIYNYDLLTELVDYYIYISGKYNKLPSTLAFSYMCNIPTNSIDVWKSYEPSSKAFKIWQKLQDNRQDCLKDKCFDSSNVVGSISVGNTEFGWNMPGVRTIERQSQNINALPEFDDNMPLGIVQNL